MIEFVKLFSLKKNKWEYITILAVFAKTHITIVKMRLIATDVFDMHVINVLIRLLRVLEKHFVKITAKNVIINVEDALEK